ncbi:MAG: 23S rRNA (adenine(2030)-N(6))-methyltransferase RlmJ [Chromatiaceae bacterium]
MVVEAQVNRTLRFSPPMLGYRHAFHAGNHADVLKHLVLVQILEDLTAKPKPICYIDTHAGAGRYDLRSGFARQNREAETGIGRLWGRGDLPPAVARYVGLVEELNPAGELRSYPGSPWLAQRLLRPDDRLVLFELHPGEIGPLEVLFQADRRAQVARTDGLEGCVGRLPPKERQGLVLMDPSYEVRTDYTRIVDTLLRAHRRFATGSFALWYPKVDRWRTDTMERIIRASGLPKVQIVELGIGGSDEGMRTSGLVLVNPPWTLAASMQTVLPWLAQALAADGKGR